MCFVPHLFGRPPLLAPLTWRTIRVGPNYACPALATITCAFVPDVSPGLANMVWCLVYDGFDNIVFGIHTFLNDGLNRVPISFLVLPCVPNYMALPCARRSTCIYLDTGNADLNIDHGVPRTTTLTTATPPCALGYLDIDTKSYHLA